MRDDRASSKRSEKMGDKPGDQPTDQREQRIEKPLESASVRSSSKDITPVLKGWDYESGTINVRKVTGIDGNPKLQMRLDLGLLQMELNGRPDGQQPHGHESLLEYFELQLKEHQARCGTELGFQLTREQCQLLRDEAAMYYQRYLSLYVLGEYGGVVRDTARNLRVLDLCGKFATEEQDRLVLEAYRPYIIMMNSRGYASMHYKAKNYPDALRAVRKGLRQIKAFFIRFGQASAYRKSNEVSVLKSFARDIRKMLPVDPIKKMQRALEHAVREERYEDAAQLRDELALRLTSPGANAPSDND